MTKSFRPLSLVLICMVLLFTLGCSSQSSPIAVTSASQVQDHKNPSLVTNTHPIEGYSDKISYLPGETVQLKVHTLAAHYAVDVMRFGETQQSLLSASNLPGKRQDYPIDAYKAGANWSTTYQFTIPSDWRSGIYAAKLTDDKGKTFYVTFIVKDPASSMKKIVVLASTNTWQAYNDWGGASFYRYNLKDSSGQKVSHFVDSQRPNPDANPVGNEGHTTQAELHILRWLEKQGYEYSLITDTDLHQHPNLLQNAKVVIISTHSEYWSKSMYDGLEAYVKKGGNVMNLSGNTLYWKVVIQGNLMEVRKDMSKQTLNGEPGGTWAHVGRPESALLGVGYNEKGYKSYAPYKVLSDKFWIFNGTDVKYGDLIGKNGLNYGGASGWETDKRDSHSPANLVVLASGTNPKQGGADMTYYDTPAGGGVFSAGSITFGGSLAVDHTLSIMMKNVLNHFLDRK